MQPIVSSERMRRYDETTIASFKTPGLVLMDRAGIAAAHIILKQFAPGKKPIAVICGKGNNGGDGFVVARVLARSGCRVTVYLTHAPTALSTDARKHFEILKKDRSAAIAKASAFTPAASKRCSIVVDALFGTGFSGSPTGMPKQLIERMNHAGVPIVSLDVPSGIDATTGVAGGSYVTARLTVAFGLIKTGLILAEGRSASGHVVCVDIGIPRQLTHGPKADTFLVEASDVAASLPVRPLSLHKYSAGKVLILAGSPGFTGAASLASHAALRSGAGAVILMTPETVYPVLARKLTSEVVIPVPSSSAGTFGTASCEPVFAKLTWPDVLLIGPGISLNEHTSAFVADVLARWAGPTVIDADALSILAGSKSLQTLMRRRDWILTPHAGEFARLSGIASASVEQDRIESARTFARRKKTTLVLKGAPTCVADPTGTCHVNTTGNPGMATIGAGDVLAGLVAGLRAQKIPSAKSAWSGVFLHGRAGDLARASKGERGMVASDILDAIPDAIQSLAVEQRS